MAERWGMSESTVFRGLHALERAGLVTVVRHLPYRDAATGLWTRRMSNTYHFRIPRASEEPAAPPPPPPKRSRDVQKPTPDLAVSTDVSTPLRGGCQPPPSREAEISPPESTENGDLTPAAVAIGRLQALKRAVPAGRPGGSKR
jgi:hypothetical protein